MFTSLTTVIAIFAAITTLGSASPIPEPQPQPVQNPCSPSFQGVETYIQAYNTYNRLWVPKGSQQNTIISTLSAGPTKWKIEGSGSPANDYTIKYVTPSNSLLAIPFRGSTLALGLAQSSGNPTFDVKCNTCYPAGTIPAPGTFIGGTCYIIEQSTGRYLTETPEAGNPGKGTVSLIPRNGSTDQFFHIVAV